MQGKFTKKASTVSEKTRTEHDEKVVNKKPLIIGGCVAGAAAVVLLGVLGMGQITNRTAPTEPTATEAVTEEVKAALPVVTADGNNRSLKCKDDYTAAADDNADAVVASMGDVKLTNRQLQLLYQMEAASYRSSGNSQQPDYSQSLATQLCPIADGGISWQHFFLQRAIDSWQTRQALIKNSQQPQIITEELYEPSEERHTKYFNEEELPASRLLYEDKPCYTPNIVHQAYLDSIPDMLKELASQKGYADTDAMAKAMAPGASAADLEQCGHDLNLAYMYYTELSYNVQPEEQEIAQLAGTMADQEKLVDMIHVLLIPENAQVGTDMTVTASDKDWENCRQLAEDLIASYRRNWRVSREGGAALFSELANKYSADPGSRLCGGRYSAVRKGQLMQELDDWCFDSSRQHGDIDFIRTKLGLHIVYWDTSYSAAEPAAKSALVQKALADKTARLITNTPFIADFSAASVTDIADGITVDDILYPDVAHQQYPEIPLYLQQDYPHAMFGFRNVAKGGCGITTLAMISTYLADRTLTPAMVGAMFGAYCTKSGTDGMIFSNVPSVMGYYLEKQSWNWTEIEQAIRDGKIVVTLQYPGYFTSAGHYMALERVTEDGNIVVRDSNIFNYPKLAGHKVDCFSPDLITAASQVYWIYEPKITRIPACARCGDLAHSDVPGQLLQQDYTCWKCSAALTRRNGFLALNEQ